MTSALQLLYILRPPVRRSQEQVSALELDHPDPDPYPRRSRRDHRHCGRGSDGAPSGPPHGLIPKTRHSKSCGSHRESELGRSSRNVGHGYLPGNNTNGGVSNSTLTRLGLTRNDHLPGAVEEAKKRLLERLSVLLTENRQRTVEAGGLNNESTVGDGFNVHPASLNHGVLGQGPSSNFMNGESTIQMQHSTSSLIENKKTQAFFWDAFYMAKGETFRSSEGKYEGGAMEQLTECCICLDGFKDEDRLVKLSCSHKFHPACLEPWVRSSGDCPLCRADIKLMKIDDVVSE